MANDKGEQQMDKYETLKLLGTGSYGECYLVREKATRELFVLKQMSLSSDKMRQSAQQEAAILQKLKHPNIVEYHDHFECLMGRPPRRMLCAVMQYCDSGDLLQRLIAQKGRQFSESQVVDYLSQILLALEYMHGQHVLHRDIKTQNVFLMRNGVVKLGDFGISKILSSNPGESDILARTVIGTPYYMSPELLSNKPYGYKSDVWAAGCVLFEMMYLKHAFEGKDYIGLMNNIVRCQTPQATGSQNYSSQLKNILYSMLSKSPEKRPRVSEILRTPLLRSHMRDVAAKNVTARVLPLAAQRDPSAPHAASPPPAPQPVVKQQQQPPPLPSSNPANGTPGVKRRQPGPAITASKLRLMRQLESTQKKKEDLRSRLLDIRKGGQQPSSEAAAPASTAALQLHGVSAVMKKRRGSGSIDNATAAAVNECVAAMEEKKGEGSVPRISPRRAAAALRDPSPPPGGAQPVVVARREAEDSSSRPSSGASAADERRHLAEKRWQQLAIERPAAAAPAERKTPVVSSGAAAAASAARAAAPTPPVQQPAVAAPKGSSALLAAAVSDRLASSAGELGLNEEARVAAELEKVTKDQQELELSLETLNEEAKAAIEEEDAIAVLDSYAAHADARTSPDVDREQGDEEEDMEPEEVAAASPNSDHGEDASPSSVANERKVNSVLANMPPSLSERVRVLKQVCTDCLGGDLFDKCHEFLWQNRESVMDDDDPQLLHLLGPENSFCGKALLSLRMTEDDLPTRTRRSTSRGVLPQQQPK